MIKRKTQTRLSKKQKLKMIDKVYNQNLDYFTPSFIAELHKKWIFFYRKGSYHYKETKSGKFICIADQAFLVRKQKYRAFVTALRLTNCKLTIAIIIENVANKRFDIFNEYSDQIGRGIGCYSVRDHGDFEDPENCQLFAAYQFDQIAIMRIKKLKRLLEIE